MRARLLFLVSFPLASSALGCTSVNHYATARMLRPGQASYGGALEATQLTREKPAPPFAAARTTTRTVSLFPALFARYGVHERVEIGGTLHAARIGGELKVGVVGGEAPGVRVAVLAAPAFQGGAFVADVPVLVSVPLHERVELTASPGLAVVRPLFGNEKDIPDGTFARGGLAVAVRVGPRVRLVPEITASTSLIGDTPLWATGGLAVVGDTP